MEHVQTSTGAMTGADLTQMVLAGASLTQVAAFLDALDHESRLAQVRSTPRRLQPKLWALAADAAPLTLEYFVPASVPDDTPVVHHGWNSLPIPAFGRRFQKPMARHRGRPDRLYGYNVSPFGPFIGPGFFLHTATAHEPSWKGRGGTVVDYFQVPDHDVPAAWPKVVPNTRGLQIFVYARTRDFMRRVSRHVTIGAAYKTQEPMGAYFMLVREDR